MISMLCLDRGFLHDKYIIALNECFMQEGFDFNFEYHTIENTYEKYFGVINFPTFILCKNGKEIQRLVGKHSTGEVIEWIKGTSRV